MTSPPVTITRDYLLAERQALLLMLDAIECMLEISPRTKELRRQVKEAERDKNNKPDL